MKPHLVVAGRGLTAIAIGSALAYLIARLTTSVHNPPAWPYAIFLGLALAGGILYFAGQERKTTRPDQPGADAPQYAVIPPPPGGQNFFIGPSSNRANPMMPSSSRHSGMNADSATPIANRRSKLRYTNCMVCGWPFTEPGGQTRPNCRVPPACAKRVAAGWLPGIGDPAVPHNRGLGPALDDGSAVTVPTVAEAKAAQATALSNGMLKLP